MYQKILATVRKPSNEEVAKEIAKLPFRFHNIGARGLPPEEGTNPYVVRCEHMTISNTPQGAHVLLTKRSRLQISIRKSKC